MNNLIIGLTVVHSAYGQKGIIVDVDYTEKKNFAVVITESKDITLWNLANVEVVEECYQKLLKRKEKLVELNRCDLLDI